MSENVTHPSGMVRGSTAGKVNYLLVHDGPMLERWAVHLTNAVESKGKRNWMKAHGPDDLERFREGFARHAAQWLRGDTDEDHAAAIMFNLNGAEHVRQSPERGIENPPAGTHTRPCILASPSHETRGSEEVTETTPLGYSPVVERLQMLMSALEEATRQVGAVVVLVEAQIAAHQSGAVQQGAGLFGG